MTLDEFKAGTYYSFGNMYVNSYRVIAKRGNRVCIMIMAGPPIPYAGYGSGTVSSVSLKGGKLWVDATNEEIFINPRPGLVPLSVDGRTFHFIIKDGRLGVWQHMKDDFQPSQYINECLSATDVYAKDIQGEFIAGITHLTAQDSGSHINLRTGPGTNFASPHHGLVGDEVSCTEVAQGEDGTQHLWYKITFDRGINPSGVTGWIREDFVNIRKH